MRNQKYKSTTYQILERELNSYRIIGKYMKKYGENS